MFDWDFTYSPILAISPAEMNALEELPEKDKDLLLPMFPLKGWVGSNTLQKSTERLKKAFGERSWVADIDSNFLADNKDYPVTGVYPREVFYEVAKLLEPNDGYKNWVDYVGSLPNAIPVVQHQDLSMLEDQFDALQRLGRGTALRFKIDDLASNKYLDIIDRLSGLVTGKLLVFFDYGKIQKDVLDSVEVVVRDVQKINSSFKSVIIFISGSSFPDEFGARSGDSTIYERRLFDRVRAEVPDAKLVYSDRGGARAESLGGGAGTPVPRIDYPLNNEWRYIRRPTEASDLGIITKETAYTLIAQKLKKERYWDSTLALWGTQLIELTSKGDAFGINSPGKSTAVRLNIHMYRQLYYDNPAGLGDTDEDWVD